MPLPSNPKNARASTTYSLLSRKARTVARPVGVRPTMWLPPLAQARCWRDLRPRVEQRRQGAGQGIEVVRFRAAIFVAAVAGSAQVIGSVAAAKRPRDDVIHYQGHADHSPRGKTVFTAVISTRKNLLAQHFGQGGHALLQRQLVQLRNRLAAANANRHA